MSGRHQLPDTTADHDTAARTRQIDTLARGGALSIVGAASGAVFGVALTAIITRGVDPTVAGTFFAATSVFLVLQGIAELGADNGVVRWIPRYRVEHRRADLRASIGISLWPVAVASVLTALALALAAPWLASVTVTDGEAERFTLVLRVMALFLPLAAVYDVITAATRGWGTMRITVGVEKLFRVVAQPIGVFVVLALGGGLLGLSLAWAVPYALSLVLVTVALARLLARTRPHPDDPAPLPRRALAGEFWRYTAPRGVARGCQVALQRADIAMVAALASPRDAAIYTAATRFLVFGQLGTLAIQQALQPQLSTLFTQQRMADALSVFQTATTWIMALAWPIYLVFASAAPALLPVFGPSYGAGETTVVILSLTMLFATAAGPVDVVLNMAGRSGLSLANNAAALGIDVVLNVILIPRYGITGAAISWSVALVARNLLPLLQVRSALQMTAFSRGAAVVGTAAGIALGALPLAVRLVAGDRMWPVLLALVVGALGYLGVLWWKRDAISLLALTAVLRRRRTPRAVAS